MKSLITAAFVTAGCLTGAAMAQTGSDWRAVDPEDLLLIEVEDGMIAIELAGWIAPNHAARSGACSVIVGGRIENVLTRLYQGESLGTLLVSDQEPMAARKQWIAGHLQTRGEITIDDGAVKALTQGGKSLLPVGAVEVSGHFGRGEVVACVNQSGQIIAKGLSNYSALETQKILKKDSKDIMNILGYMDEPELIHRDNLVLV